jgi:hypothetical protein
MHNNDNKENQKLNYFYLINVKKQSGFDDSVHDKNSSQYIRQLISVAYNNYNMLFCITIIVVFCLGGCEKNESITLFIYK